MDVYGFKDRNTAERLKNFAGQLDNQPVSGMANPPLERKNVGDPDTPHRQTVRVNEAYDDQLAGTPIAVLIDHPGGSGFMIAQDELILNTGTYPDHRLGIQQGTISFLNQDKEQDGDDVAIKTSNGGFILNAIVYQTDKFHDYAMVDSTSVFNPPKYLISCEYGPYRIIGKKNVEPWAGAPSTTPYPRFVIATIKEQVTDRDIGTYHCAIVEDLSSGFAVGRFFLQGGAVQSGRFGLPDIAASPWLATKSNLTLNGPSPLYIVDATVRLRLVRKQSTGVMVTLDGPAGASLNIHSFPQVELKLKRFGILHNGTEELIDQSDILIESKVSTSTVSSPPPLDCTTTIRVITPLVEKYKSLKVVFEDVNMHLGSAGGMNGMSGSGYMMIHRLGDRGAILGDGAKSQGMTLPVFEPEVPEEPL